MSETGRNRPVTCGRDHTDFEGRPPGWYFELPELIKRIDEYEGPKRRALEIGCYMGLSTSVLVERFDEVHTVDILGDPQVGCIHHLGSSYDVHQRQAIQGEFDFLHIDADHSYGAVKQDILLWTPFLRSGGLICFHDWEEPSAPGVKQAIEEAGLTAWPGAGHFRHLFWAIKP